MSQQPGEGYADRLGLLAVSCSDGHVRVYAPPSPAALAARAIQPGMSVSFPHLILLRGFGHLFLSLCWYNMSAIRLCSPSRTMEVNRCIVVGGSSNGTVCIWRLSGHPLGCGFSLEMFFSLSFFHFAYYLILAVSPTLMPTQPLPRMPVLCAASRHAHSTNGF